MTIYVFFSSRRRHTRSDRDWSSDVCSSDLVMEVVVQKMEPERLFSFHWHPYAVDPKTDYSKEKPTLVEFKLEKTASGTRLTVVESGFDSLPEGRRDEAFRMNSGGWAQQIKNIEKHVTQT